MASRFRSLQPEHRTFLNHLSWSALGGTVGAGLMFLVSLIAGRYLGPERFGSAMFAMLVAQLFATAATGGLDIAASRAVPGARSTDERREIISSAAALLLPLVLVAGVLGVALTPLVAARIGASEALYAAGIGLGVTMALRVALDRQVGALHLFRFQSLLKLSEGVVAMAVLGTSIVLGPNHERAFLVAIAAASLLVVGRSAVRIRAFARGSAVSRARLRSLRRVGGIAILHAITPAGFVFFDRIAIKSELGDVGLGVYAAYYASSFMVVAQVTAIVTNVLMPYTAERPDKRGVVALLNRLQRWTMLPLVAFMWLVVAVIMKLGFGASYDFDAPTGLLAATWASLLFYNGLLTTVTVTHSERSFIYTVALQGLRSVLFVAFAVTLMVLDQLTVPRVIAGMVAIEALDALNLRFVIARTVWPRAERQRSAN